MATARFPDGIDEAHTRGASRLRTAGFPLLVLGTVVMLALFGVFGGTRATALRATGGGADLAVRLPATLRSGMFFEMEVEVAASRPIDDATITVSPALWRHMTINTMLPEPKDQAFRDGRYILHYGPLRPGARLAVTFDGQINPDLFAGTRGVVAVRDGARTLVSLPVRIRVLP